jgi:hypothetical protein
MKKRRKEELLEPSKSNPIAKVVSNPIAKVVRSRTFRPKVIQSKKLYNRSKEKTSLKVATKEGD